MYLNLKRTVPPSAVEPGDLVDHDGRAIRIETVTTGLDAVTLAGRPSGATGKRRTLIPVPRDGVVTLIAPREVVETAVLDLLGGPLDVAGVTWEVEVR